MWFRAEEFNPGILWWDSREVSTVTARLDHAEVPINPVSIHNSAVKYWRDTTGARERIAFTLEPGPDAAPERPLARLRWARSDGGVETRIWYRAGDDTVESRLIHIPDFGSFYRIVINVSRLSWQGDRVYYRGRDTVRFVTGKISGHRSSPTGTRHDGESMTSVARLGPETLDGRFIEIVAASHGTIGAPARALGDIR